jgi:cell division protein FtsW (lipid II flippase)
MDRALARSRISFTIVQTLLGLIFLAWLPAIDQADSGASFPIQLEETLLLSDLSDIGEADREAFPGEWNDGKGSSDALVPAGTALATGGTLGQGNHFSPRQPVRFNVLGSLRATGPPRL